MYSEISVKTLLQPIATFYDLSYSEIVEKLQVTEEANESISLISAITYVVKAEMIFY